MNKRWSRWEYLLTLLFIVYFVGIILSDVHMLSWQPPLDLPLVICIYVVVMAEIDSEKKDGELE